MSICTFFGHKDCPESLKPHLREALLDLILNYGVDTFYVGNQGCFDTLVRQALRELAEEYPHICYAVVLAYLPSKQTGGSDTLLPEGIETIHPRYAISWRNNWMLRQAEFVVTYITHPWGGAAKYVKKAANSGKIVINLAV